MMQLRFGFTLALSALSLAGCSTIGISNGSLDYKNTTTLEPLKYPEGAMVRPATPLYPAPVVEPLAIEHAPKFENKRANRFDLPRPEVAQITASNSSAEASTTVKIDNKTYILRLTSVGSSNNLAVFNADSSFADKEKAAELLTQIYQNWPA